MISLNSAELPVLCLKDTVLFPNLTSTLFVGREVSIKAFNEAERKRQDYIKILIVTQKNEKDEISSKDCYQVGVLARVIQTVKMADNKMKILVEATQRVKLTNLHKQDDYFSSEYEVINDLPIKDIEKISLISEEVTELFIDYIKSNKRLSSDLVAIIQDVKNPAHLSNLITSHLTCKLDTKQELLANENIAERLEKLKLVLKAEISVMETERVVQERVKKQMEKTQKDYYLNEQIKAIQKELGEDDKTELHEIEKKIKSTKLSKEAKQKAYAELKKLKLMNPMAAEAGVVRNYLDTLLSLPWGKKDQAKIEINKAQEILDEDHYGLEKIKERIIEYLAVQQRAKKLKGPIICLVGPPGVGKTSLAKSIASSTNRKFAKFALGGMRDEAEIRGHRKTYLGSMPGKILNLLKRVKTSNPVMLLDEIDKMSSDYKGDPSSALLEVLDPEQNAHFVDHYLEVEYDLSDVMFIATANSLNLPRPLLDRMEIIRIAGYIECEKLEICKRHLIPKQLKDHELKKEELSISDDALLDIIRYYTKESGVRSLEREISKLARKALKEILQNSDIDKIEITPANLEKYLGVKKFNFGLAEQEDLVGISTGLAYSEVGGDLMHLETVALPGKGEIKLTGKLGEVMQESAQAAFSYFKSKASEFGITAEFYNSKNLHTHVPEGAIPKDGPSAGIAMFTSIVSAMSGIKVKRDVAMTGEITLRGRVLPIGGLKEKLLAALRGGIKTVIIPQENKKDLRDLPKSITDNLDIIPVETASEVLDIALESKFADNVINLIDNDNNLGVTPN